MSRLIALSGLLTLLFHTALAENDWSKPCFSGQCSFDVQQTKTSMGGTIVISGSSNAISDVTPSAGWEVLNCSSTATSQEIRLVCTGDTESCNHLFQNGAENTIVRLPQNCGKGPFAIVSKVEASSNQSVTPNVANRLFRRGGSPPQVQQISVHTNFSQVTSSPHGPVSFAVAASSFPGAIGNLTLGPNFDFDSTFHELTVVSNFSIGSFNENESHTFPEVDVNQPLNLFSQSASCGPFTGEVSVDFDAVADVVATVGIVASGSVIPPKLSKFALTGGLSGTVSPELTLSASLTGTLDSGKVTLASIGLPGFDIAGIIDIGPSLDLDVEGTASLDLSAELVVSLPYEVNLQLIFPPSQGASSATFTQETTNNLQLQTVPGSPSGLTFEAHLIPTLNFGIDVLSGLAEATVFLDLDSSATLGFDLEAHAGVGLSGNPNADFTGCVDLSSAININAGVEGNLDGLFDASQTVNLFSTSFDLFDKCFSGSTKRSKRDALASPSFKSGELSLEKRALSCPASEPELESV